MRRQTKKQVMSRGQVPYRRDRMQPGAGGVATGVGGVVAAVEVVVVAAIAAADEAVGYDGAAGAGVTERGMTRTWD